MGDAWYEFELTRPWLLLGLLVVPLVAWYFHRSLVDLPRWQRAVSFVVRALVVALLVAALAGLTLLEPTRQQFIVFATDRSESVGDDAREKAEQFIDDALTARGSHQAAFVEFAAAPGRVRRDRDQTSEQPEVRGTNLADAIEVAAAAIPPFYVPKIVILSDGNQTGGDAIAAALSAGIPISTVPLPSRDEAEVQVSEVNVPAQVPQGEPFYVEVVVDSNHEDEGTIEVFRGAHKIVSETRKIEKGQNTFRFSQSVTRERLAQFTARITDFEDTLLDNNTHSGLVFAAGKPRVLLVDSAPQLVKQLAWALEEEDILVDVRPVEGVPTSLSELQNFELVMLSNVPATSLSVRQMQLLRTYVEQLGGGLIMIGGDQSFGLGGYYKTVLEEVLPVRSDFEKQKEQPSLAMALVIDKSGSMGGQKIELAKDAAKGAVDLLGARDKIGVIGFDGEAYWICDMHPCSDKPYVLDRISTLVAGGGTNLYPAMEEAFLALNETIAKLKHVIVLSDGHSAPGDFLALASSMANARITVSTVAVGDGADQILLQEIADLGRGRYYFCDDPLAVPQIFAKETVTASKSAINERPFVPQSFRPTQVLGEIDLASAPFLLGYVVTRPKPTSEVVLLTETGDPLLTWWRYGLGLTTAFTSDAKSRWAAEWLSWPEFSKFWSQLVRHTMRRADAKGFHVDVTRNDDSARVVVDTVDAIGSFINQADTQLTVIAPDLSNHNHAMSQVAPGRYEAQVDVPQSGAYHFEIAQRLDGRDLNRQSRGLSVGYSDELRLRPTDEELLMALATVSGGSFDPQAASIFAPAERSTRRATPLWPLLITLAAALWVFDVALRRIDLSLLLGRFRRRRFD